MKDKTVGTEDARSDDFDLDSFLRENAFLPDEDKGKTSSKTGRAVEGAAKQGAGQTKGRTVSRRPSTGGTSSGASTSSASSKTAGTGTPSASVDDRGSDSAFTAAATTTSSKDNSTSRSTTARTTTRTTASGRPKTAAARETATRETTGTREAAGSRQTAATRGAATTRKPVTARTRDSKQADPNATMTYEELNEDYPEIPLVESKTGNLPKAPRTRVDSTTAAGSKAGSDLDAALSAKAADTAGFDAETPVRKPRPRSTASVPADARKARSTTSPTPRKARTATRAPSASSASSTDASAAAPAAARRQSVSPASRTPVASRTSSASRTPAASRTNSKRAPRLSTRANPQDFQQARLSDNAYRIRGGGTHDNTRSPLTTILTALVIIVGVGLLGFFFKSVYDNFVVAKPDESIIVLTPAETREAIDSQLPRMLDYINSSVDEANAAFVEAGWNVVIDQRVSTNNLDRSSAGNEIIHLSPSVDQAVLDRGYYEGEFNAYDFDELQQSFNGAWMLDISRGDRGTYLQIEYVNFAASSLDEELEHLRALQGLDGENSAIDSRGEDEHGNTYIRGYSVIGGSEATEEAEAVEGTMYYWEVIGIAFGDYYGGQDRRDLPPTAVLVKCRLANFDFYGAGTSTT